MSKPAISVENLSKAYRIGQKDEVPNTLMGALTGWVKAPLRNFQRIRRLTTFAEEVKNRESKAASEKSATPVEQVPANGNNGRSLEPAVTSQESGLPQSASNLSTQDSSPSSDIIWALNDVSFEVQQGEVLGIIGRNGAGKSTLLKVLSRITEPTSGRAIIRGRVSSLLEVGTGFHPELSGRENIYMNGTILGMRKKEIDDKFDEIVDFSGVERFLDTPIKRYSSGMKVRLAFAVAAHLEPEILIIDEVLAVGDSEFQKKCLGKMEDVARGGRTVLFVSHNMAAVESLCTRAIRLDSGNVTIDGDVTRVIDTYQNTSDGSISDVDLTDWPRPKEYPFPLMTRIQLRNFKGHIIEAIAVGQDAVFEVTIQPNSIDHSLMLSIGFNSPRGETVFRCNSVRQYGTYVDIHRPTVMACKIRNIRLIPGHYGITLALKTHAQAVDVITEGLAFDVVPRDVYGTGNLPPMSPNYGYILPEAEWEFRQID